MIDPKKLVSKPYPIDNCLPVMKKKDFMLTAKLTQYALPFESLKCSRVAGRHSNVGHF